MNFLVQAGLALQIVLVVALFAKQFWRRLPIFALYSVVSAMGTAAYYIIRQYSIVYFYTYWIVEVLGVVLGLGVLYEIFQGLLASQPALRRLARWVFQGAALVLTILATIVIIQQWPRGGTSLRSGVLVAEEAARVIEIGLLMFLFLFSSIFGLHWRRHEFGIALGLGVFVAVQLIVVTMKAHVGLVGADTLSIIRIVSFDLSLLIWLGYILVPERVASQAEVPQRAQLEQWNRAMMELINQ